MPASSSIHICPNYNPTEPGKDMLMKRNTIAEMKNQKTKKKTAKKQNPNSPDPFPEKTRGTWYPDFPLSQPTRQVEAEEFNA